MTRSISVVVPAWPGKITFSPWHYQGLYVILPKDFPSKQVLLFKACFVHWKSHGMEGEIERRLAEEK